MTVGLFDGLHLGHRDIFQRVVSSANAQGLRSVVLTFDVHPRDVLRSASSSVPLLTTLDERLALFAATDIDLALVIHFDHGLSQLSPFDFVQTILKGRVGMRKIVVGYNHGFGRQRSGDRETLIAMSKTMGFTVDVVNPARLGDRILSSTYLRELVADGQVALSAQGLGRLYSVEGVVVRGAGRGRRLGWPTANLGLIKPGKLAPRDGIYAGLAKVRGATHPAAISIGNNPTFAEGKHTLEAHLIHFDDDIYDENLELRFVDRIRSEKKFSSEAELSAQIAEDVRVAEGLLQSRGLLNHASR